MADDLSVTREGDTLVIRIPISTPAPSASGKTLVVASTRGNQKTAVQIDGKEARTRPTGRSTWHCSRASSAATCVTSSRTT